MKQKDTAIQIKTLPAAGDFEPPLDPGIEHAVRVLSEAGIETYESCEGGPGHSYPEPTVAFHGGRDQGFHALATALQNGLQVVSLRRVWHVIDGEPTGPKWEITFARQDYLP